MRYGVGLTFVSGEEQSLPHGSSERHLSSDPWRRASQRTIGSGCLINSPVQRTLQLTEKLTLQRCDEPNPTTDRRFCLGTRWIIGYISIDEVIQMLESRGSHELPPGSLGDASTTQRMTASSETR